MAVYSISDLEKLSGIKAHTIRIWEQRYDLLEPKRTETNIRYYLDHDLKHLLNVVFLKKSGFRISKIAQMPPSEISQKVKDLSEEDFENEAHVDALTISMIEMDEYKFDRIVSLNIKEMGFEKTMLQVIHPFLNKLSVLWMTGSVNPVQESFITYLIRQKLLVAIDQEKVDLTRKTKKFIIYIPKGEMQELTLLFMHYLLKKRNHRVIYLGQNINLQDLKIAYDIHHPDYVFTMITESFNNQNIQTYMDSVSSIMPNSHILFTGPQVVSQVLITPEHSSILTGLNDTLDFISAL